MDDKYESQSTSNPDALLSLLALQQEQLTTQQEQLTCKNTYIAAQKS